MTTLTTLQIEPTALKPAPIADKLDDVRRNFVFRDVDYVFKRRASIEDFLREHPRLIGLLPEAARRIGLYFGWEFPLALQLFFDPEDGNGELLILLKTRRSVEETLSRFDEDWWFTASEQVDCLVSLMPEYVSAAAPYRGLSSLRSLGHGQTAG